MLSVGVARFLAKLAIPGGAIVQVLESTYDVYQTVVARAKEILKVGLTLFNAAQSLEQGNTRLAAKSIEGVLSQLLPVALDFLARTFQLDKLPVLVRAALQALRAPVDKGINWVVDKIIAFAKLAWKALKAGGKAVGQAGRDAVGAVRGWLGLRQPITLVGGEKHTLFFAPDGTLMIASEEQSVGKLLNSIKEDLRKKVKESTLIAPQIKSLQWLIPDTNKEEIQQAEALHGQVEEIKGKIKGINDEPEEPKPTNGDKAAITAAANANVPLVRGKLERITPLLAEMRAAIEALMKHAVPNWRLNYGKYLLNDAPTPAQENLIFKVIKYANDTPVVCVQKELGKEVPGIAAGMRFTNGRIILGNSIGGSKQEKLFNGLRKEVRDALDKVPKEEKSEFHGFCGELQVISAALNQGISVGGLKDAESFVLRVREEAPYFSPLCACSSCQAVLKSFGIKDLVARVPATMAGGKNR